MAKYVGKIFKISNKDLNIRGVGAHNVHVQWYNPFKRVFRCRVITSLETSKELDGKLKKELDNTAYYYDKKNNVYHLFRKKRYLKLRSGVIEPIPMEQTKGFEHWSGYYGAQDLNINTLKKGKAQKGMEIIKKRK